MAPGHFRYYRMEDADCPIRQFMVLLEYQESRFGMLPSG